MSIPRKTPSLILLEAYHGDVYSLLEYLAMNIDPCTLPKATPETHDIETSAHTQDLCIKHYLLKDTDPIAYRDLLMSAVLAVTENDPKQKKMQIIKPSISTSELIDHAHSRLFSRARKPASVLAAGYRPSDFRSEAGRGGASGARQGITNFFVNTLVTALQDPEWSLLFSRTGDEIVLHLLTKTSIYVSLPNDCYCQLTGPPLINLPIPQKRLFAKSTSMPKRGQLVHIGSPERDGMPHKRRRKLKEGSEKCAGSILGTPNSGKKRLERPPSTILISRPFLFYARPTLVGRGSTVLLGFSREHVLNRMMTDSWRSKKGLGNSKVWEDLRLEDRDGAFEARHLLKYIFPLQYQLESVFHIPENRSNGELLFRWRFNDRENEIDSLGNCKTPKRLKNVLPLLAQLYQRHTKCKYKALLDDLCPTKLKPNLHENSADSVTILELISEEDSETYLQSQILCASGDTSPTSFPRNNNTTDSNRMIDARAKDQVKPKFAEFTCSFTEVYLFVCAVTRAVIPFELWGSHKNKRTILHYVKQLITGGRYETLSLHKVLQEIRVNDCDWLLPVPRGKRRSVVQFSIVEPEMLKRRQLMEEFLFWYFDQFLVPLLRNTFYITESSAFRNRVLYFRQDDWDLLCQPLLSRLADATFERIPQKEAEDLLKQHKLGHSIVRLLPKETGVRPIVNLRRKRKTDDDQNPGHSINQILSAAFQILTYEKTKQIENLGSSVFGPNEIYPRLKDFKQRIISSSEKMPKLYFVKVDVQACFDTIEQDKLLSILKDLISEEVYMLHKHGRLCPTKEQPMKKFYRQAIPEYDHPLFLTYSKQLATLLKYTIFTDQVVYPYTFREDIEQLLEDHITSNIVKIGEEYYRQRVGIPQGSVLSTLLCSFFYGNLEKEELKFTTDHERQNILLRLIDDYLFITTDREEACQFLEIMNRGHPQYGCFIAKDKTLTNFDHRVGDISQLSLSTVLHPESKLFPWCGYLINTQDLSVMGDYSRLQNKDLSDSLTVERCTKPNTRFVQKLMQSVKAKSHIIFTDTGYNSPETVRANVYQAFILAAMKMHVYIRSLRQSERGNRSGLEFLSSASENASERPQKGLRQIKEERTKGHVLLNAIRRSINSTYSSIQNKVQEKLAQEAGGSCDLTKDEITWLGIHAFYNILKRKRTTYHRMGVLGGLLVDLSKKRYQVIDRRYKKMVKECLENMIKGIKF